MKKDYLCLQNVIKSLLSRYATANFKQFCEVIIGINEMKQKTPDVWKQLCFRRDSAVSV